VVGGLLYTAPLSSPLQDGQKVKYNNQPGFMQQQNKKYFKSNKNQPRVTATALATVLML